MKAEGLRGKSNVTKIRKSLNHENIYGSFMFPTLAVTGSTQTIK